MRLLKISVLFAFAVIILPAFFVRPVASDNDPTEAPAAFDTMTNGLVDQDTHDEDADVFAEQEFIADGLGPVYNAQSCGECHQNPVTGAISQIAEMRVANFVNNVYTDPPGDNLIHSRAINAAIQERVPVGFNVRTFRTSLNTLGDGFVEAIANSTIEDIASAQPSGLRGSIARVPVIEANNTLRIGRFGHKNQHASLVSFSADAYLNEMGITNPFKPFNVENTSNGRSVAAFDTVADPEDDGGDVLIFARFMRGTKVPPRAIPTSAAQATQIALGQATFTAIGCAVCHTPSIVTAPAGTVINGGAFTVPAALGNKRIRPFGDFLLHDIGTGDGIIQNAGAGSRNQVRTAPLWGLRTHNRLMHDGLSFTTNEAIQRHGGQASVVRTAFNALPQSLKDAVSAFLDSL